MCNQKSWLCPDLEDEHLEENYAGNENLDDLQHQLDYNLASLFLEMQDILFLI